MLPKWWLQSMKHTVFLSLFGRFLGPGPWAKKCDLWGQVRGRKIGGTNRGGRDDSAVLTLPRGPKSLASSGTRSRGKASTSAASRGSAVHSSSDLCRTCSAPKSRRRAVVSFKWNQPQQKTEFRRFVRPKSAPAFLIGRSHIYPRASPLPPAPHLGVGS